MDPVVLILPKGEMCCRRMQHLECFPSILMHQTVLAKKLVDVDFISEVFGKRLIIFILRGLHPTIITMQSILDGAGSAQQGTSNLNIRGSLEMMYLTVQQQAWALYCLWW